MGQQLAANPSKIEKVFDKTKNLSVGPFLREEIEKRVNEAVLKIKPEGNTLVAKMLDLTQVMVNGVIEAAVTHTINTSKVENRHSSGSEDLNDNGKPHWGDALCDLKAHYEDSDGDLVMGYKLSSSQIE